MVGTAGVRHLFVYGQLLDGNRNGRGTEQSARLRREATLVGAATMRGRLYDFGAFPGAVDSDADGDIVHGQVLLLGDPAATFQWLDAYEHCFAADPASSMYLRQVRPVTLGARESVTAWVYVYAQPCDGARHIASGRWLSVVG
jgi:gamma-glutamylcyclotransferase (GGCT)/AIG2-like uncharacterized protein YtfP